MYRDIFENGDLFPRFANKYASNVAYSNPFRPFTSIKTPKRQIYDSIPLRACVMLVVYDA